MRPISLTVEGLRSFRKPVTIDFADRNQLAIVGDTGAGKSSILDAITYALYRQTTFSKQPNQELMNALAMQMRVVLTFAVAGETWIVTRALKRPSGDVASVTPTLRRVADDGVALESVEGAADVDDRIRRIVGLDGDAFLRTVVLPQGNFARLLIADKPAERATVLRQVWRTDELEAAGEVAGLKATETGKLRAGLETAASLHPDDPEVCLAALRKTRTERRKEARKTKQDLDGVSAAIAALQQAENEGELCQDVLRHVEGVAVSPLVTRLDQIVQNTSEITREENRLNRKIATIQHKLTELAPDARLLAELGETIAKLDRVALYIGNADNVARSLRDRSVDMKTAQDDAAKAQQKEDGHRRDAEVHGSGKDALDNALAAAEAHSTKVRERYAACEASRSNLATARQELLDLQEEVESHAALATKLREEVNARHQTKERMDALLEEAKRTDFAASAAQGFHAGDDCPVCAQTLPNDWQAPMNADIADAKAAATAAGHALVDARRESGEVEVTLAASRSRRDDAGQAVGVGEVQFSDALQVLQDLVPGLLDELPDELPDEETVLGPLDDKLARAKKTVEQHDSKQRILDQVLNDARLRTAAAKAKAEGLAPQLEAAGRGFAESTTVLKRELADLPEPFQPSILVPDDWRGFDAIDRTDLHQKRAAAKDRRAELLEKDKERKALEGERKELEEKQKQIAVRREQKVAVPLSQLCREANTHIQALTLAVGRLDIPQSLPATLASADVTKIRSGLTEIRATFDAVHKKATERVDHAMEKRGAASATLTKFAECFNVKEDDWQAVADAAGEADETARLHKLQAEKAFDDFSAIFDDVRKLRALLAETRAKERALTDVANALKPGGFLKWLTLRRSRSLLSHASVLLKQMSGGRYAFADPDEADAPWHVLDSDSGQARSPASLSGGEQFIAALALALGMVEMMARSGGKLESLFLDEGFGSLDRNNLDAAVEALAMVANRGRMVGVISHVRAVAEQFDNVLAVDREEGGSQARWLTGAQRREMAEDALTGLLD